MSEGTVHPLAQPVGRTHASGAFDWRAVPSADPRTSAFALDTAPALPAAAEEFSGEACREIVEDLLDRTRTGCSPIWFMRRFASPNATDAAAGSMLIRSSKAVAGPTHWFVKWLRGRIPMPRRERRFRRCALAAERRALWNLSTSSMCWPKPVNICRFPTTAASSFRHVCTDSPKKRLRLRLRAASRGSSFR